MNGIEVSWTHQSKNIFDIYINTRNLSRSSKKQLNKFAAFSFSFINPLVLARLGTISDVAPEFDGTIESLIPPNLKKIDFRPFLSDKVDLNLISQLMGESRQKLLFFGAMCFLILFFSALFDLFYKQKKKNPKNFKYKETNWKTILKEIFIIILSLAALLLPIWIF